MAVNLNLPAAIPVAGVDWVTLASGIKKDGVTDLVLAKLADSSHTAAVFTQSAFAAAPVMVCRRHMQENSGVVRALLINSGNANAGTGEPGLTMAAGHCEAVADALNVPAQSVLPFSTGVIGQLLPDDIVRRGIERAGELLGSDAPLSGDTEANTNERLAAAEQQWQDAARGIMTTDTHPKLTSQQVSINGTPVTITGMAKGAGMIQPNMATMLSYVFTDATIGPAELNEVLREVVDVTFNAITVDSDTSTNDSLVLVATGIGEPVDTQHPDWQAFKAALTQVCLDLAQGIIRDAEGATKFISVNVTGGLNTAECKCVGYAVANSPLVKTAMFASDANVGRLLMAIGKADIPTLDADLITVSLGDVVAFEKAGIAAGYTEERGAAVMSQDEIDVTIDLGLGEASASIYTSDLSHEYVSINADYRS